MSDSQGVEIDAFQITLIVFEISFGEGNWIFSILNPNER